MCEPISIGVMMGLGALTAAQGAEDQSVANKSLYEHQARQEGVKAEHQAAVERNRAIVSEYQAKDAIVRGQTLQTQIQLKTAQIKGAQRARFAAAGLSLDEGSAANVIADTDFMGANDALTVADNAEKEAWAFRESAKVGMSNAAFLQQQGGANVAFLQGRAAAEDPGRAFGTSLLGSAGQVASSWYRMRVGDGTGTRADTGTRSLLSE